MAATLSVTVNIPAADSRGAEVMWAAHALTIAAHEIRRAGGQVTNGKIVVQGGVNVGEWTYVPQAKS